MNQPTALERFVERLRRRSELSAKEADAILSLKGDEVATKARGIIVRPGDTVDRACLVVRGIAARFDELRDGTRQISEIYLRGDMCDLHSVPVPQTAWGIQALTSTTTIRIPHAQLHELVRKYPAIAMAFWRDTVADASILTRRITVLGRLKAKARVAHFICGIGLRMEIANLGRRTHFSLPITFAQWAEVVGLTVPYVQNTLSALQKAGKIDKRGSEIEVLDLDYLIRCAQFDPRYLLLNEGST